jgi:hypothetical protein
MGRNYTMTVTSTDASGNSTQQNIDIAAPKDKPKNNKSAVAGASNAEVNSTRNGLKVTVMNYPSSDRFTLLTHSSSDQLLQYRVLYAQGRLVEARANQALGTWQLGSSYRTGVYYMEVVQGKE